MRASSTVGAGRPGQRNGGGTSWSSQVNPIGIIAPGAKAGLVSRIRCPRASTGDVLTSTTTVDMRPSVASTATTRRTTRRLGAAAVDEADVGEEDPRRADQIVDAPNRERWPGATAPSEPQGHAGDDQERPEPDRDPRTQVPGADRSRWCRGHANTVPPAGPLVLSSRYSSTRYPDSVGRVGFHRVPRDDYQGDFDPDFELSHLSRQGLAVLGREYMLSGQLQERSAMPMVLGRLGVEARIGIAIDEWMSASPLYSARMQRALRFSGTDIGTLFKNLQLDIGFSHSYMHVGYRLENEGYGEFWLDCCGALMDVEPFGEDMVRGMCHDIEDPTFDATAAATNPLIKIRPIHRPPRSPADREPHCRWKVFIDDAPNAEPFEMHPNLAIVASSKLADVALVDPGGDAEP